MLCLPGTGFAERGTAKLPAMPLAGKSGSALSLPAGRQVWFVSLVGQRNEHKEDK
ncbi:MAG: hypothetical protein MUO53_11120 [Maribacter sp.]|nr:hypothetical protein [Maribacter sp.]